MKTVTFIALIIVVHFFCLNTGNAQTAIGTKNIPKENEQKNDTLRGEHFATDKPAIPNSKPDSTLEIYEESAEFPGGREALSKYLVENMVYPQIAVKKKLEGKCYLRYVISEKGYVTSVKVTKGVPSCPECDQEAVRLIKKMPKWKPCKNNGVAVNCYFNIVISFQLS